MGCFTFNLLSSLLGLLDKTLRRERGQGNLARLIHTLAICVTIHTYMAVEKLTTLVYLLRVVYSTLDSDGKPLDWQHKLVFLPCDHVVHAGFLHQLIIW